MTLKIHGFFQIIAVAFSNGFDSDIFYFTVNDGKNIVRHAGDYGRVCFIFCFVFLAAVSIGLPEERRSFRTKIKFAGWS
jgi:hypothetical protein